MRFRPSAISHSGSTVENTASTSHQHIDFVRDDQRLQRTRREEMGDDETGGDQRGVGGKAHRAEFVHQPAARDQVDGVGDGAAEHQHCAEGGQAAGRSPSRASALNTSAMPA